MINQQLDFTNKIAIVTGGGTGIGSGVAFALVGGFIVYGLLKLTVGIRLSEEEEFNGADLSIHKVSASPERETSW